MISKADLPAYITECVEGSKYKLPADKREMGVSTLFEAERELLVRALKAAGRNKTRAAELLGVSRPRLYKMIQRHGVQE